LQIIYKAEAFVTSIIKDRAISKETIQQPSMAVGRKKTVKKTPAKTLKTKKSQKEKGIDTKEVSFKLYKEGKTIEEIMAERSLMRTTIEGHLAHFVREKKIDVKEFISQEKLEKVKKLVEEIETTNLAPLKELLGSEFSYTEIKLAVAGILAENE
jgi:uncharacterized protein YpbB